MLFLRSVWKNKYLFLLFSLAFCLITRVWVRQPLLNLLPDNGFLGDMELLLPFAMLLPISFLLYEPFEIELGLVCGVRTAKLMMTRFLGVLLSCALPLLILCGLFRYRPLYIPNPEEIPIPIHVPENYRVYMVASLLVTVLFFASLFLLLRVATKNCYAPVGVGVLVYTIFQGQNINIRGTGDVGMALADPFISSYFIGDKVPIEHYGMGNLWTYNRLLFLGLALGMLAVTYVLLRREKLHQGFND